jgi:hypothetical protein
MTIARIYNYVLVLLAWKVIFLSGCSSGWYGTTAHIQESQDFTKQGKSEIIEQFGIPDGFFKNKEDSRIEYWLLCCFFGEKETKKVSCQIRR